MLFGRVVGTVWAARKDPRLEHHKLLLVRPYGVFNPSHRGGHVVAVDSDVDAGVGDDVVVCVGSPARWSIGGVNYPVDAAVMAVVDRCQMLRAAFEPGAPCRAAFVDGVEPNKVEWV